MSDPIAANCSSCAGSKKFTQQAGEPMFIYTDLCFAPKPKGRRVRVRTKRGQQDGPEDTTLFVVNEARSVTIWDDASYLVCSDGSQPSPQCGGAHCAPAPPCACVAQAQSAPQQICLARLCA